MNKRGHQGQEAETLACHLLKKNQLKLVSKNYHCRYGEIDLIMQDGKTLVFVEVRYRKSAVFGGALESINKSKQNKLRLTAQHYLQNTGAKNNARFDVVLLSSLTDPDSIEWIKSAFE